MLKFFLKRLHEFLERLPRYLAFGGDFIAFKKASGGNGRLRLNWADRYPCLNDKGPKTGFDRHYLYHPAWAARIIARQQPRVHVDISSSLHFCSMLSAFVPVQFYDFRPADIELSGIRCERADLLHLPFGDNSIHSLSCMHVVEHVGLGRYGDPLAPEADLDAVSELIRVLAPGGSLLFVVPVGRPARVRFNAHRIYGYRQIVEYFKVLELVEFSLIPDAAHGGGLVLNAAEELADVQSYGCGCFWFRKLNP